MGKIDVFDYIERAANTLDANAVGFSHAADKLTEYLESTFGSIDATVAVTSRIKSRDSLREKILRNSLYKDADAERIVFEMHDIIGVRIECRFFKDEKFLYERIREIFSVDVGDGFFSPVGKKAIRLKLDTPQPEKQKNGFNIYRIDGAVAYAGENYNFELQIKSLVNTFWSEIEHKLIYKNIRFSPADRLMKDMLNSIHESLTGIDHQLNLIFDRMNGNSLNNQQAQLQSMLALAVNEVYTAIVKTKTGIDVSITDYSEAIVHYLLTSSSYVKNVTGVPMKKAIRQNMGLDDGDEEADEDDINYSNIIVNLMEWMRGIDYNSIDIGGKIELDIPTEAQNEITKIFIENINKDFYLNTFFHIYFSLERGNDSEDFCDYIDYYSKRILNGKTQDQVYKTLSKLFEVPTHKLPLESTIEMLEKAGL